MKKSDFYYDLPKELIAQHPSDKRDHSRMLVLDRKKDVLEHRHFYEIAEYLRPGDCLVMNDSRVIPARLYGADAKGYPVETLLLRDIGEDRWEVLTRPGKKCRVGTKLAFGELLSGEIVEIVEGGNRILKFSYKGIFTEILAKLGQVPLPPYITEKLEDPERYQTVYSRVPGSAAAPTAGLHFTKELLEQVKAMGVETAFVTLHVGIGTFRPVKAEEIAEHVMHSEYYEISAETREKIERAKANGGRVIAVGTTSCRTLESAADENGKLAKLSGWTDIFIYPGYRFKILDGLITNFHLPESTLIMLVSALAGRERILSAYSKAIKERYRFFSFGDCMLIL
jgi:S-adenosylmethionine:tRNA ribosyltransferase-isomerase